MFVLYFKLRTPKPPCAAVITELLANASMLMTALLNAVRFTNDELKETLVLPFEEYQF